MSDEKESWNQTKLSESKCWHTISHVSKFDIRQIGHHFSHQIEALNPFLGLFDNHVAKIKRAIIAVRHYKKRKGLREKTNLFALKKTPSYRRALTKDRGSYSNNLLKYEYFGRSNIRIWNWLQISAIVMALFSSGFKRPHELTRIALFSGLMGLRVKVASTIFQRYRDWQEKKFRF